MEQQLAALMEKVAAGSHGKARALYVEESREKHHWGVGREMVHIASSCKASKEEMAKAITKKINSGDGGSDRRGGTLGRSSLSRRDSYQGKKVSAVIDTGAMMSVISPKLTTQLDLRVKS